MSQCDKQYWKINHVSRIVIITSTAVFLDYVDWALLRRAYGWETEKWDLRGILAKTEADSLREEQLGKLGEEEEPAIERRGAYTD